MSALKDKPEEFTTHIKEYVETFYDLTTVKATGKATHAASSAIIAIVIVVTLVISQLFIGIGVAWWLGTILSNMLAGFAIVSAAYLLFVGIILIFRKSFVHPFLRDFLIRQVYE